MERGSLTRQTLSIMDGQVLSRAIAGAGTPGSNLGPTSLLELGLRCPISGTGLMPTPTWLCQRKPSPWAVWNSLSSPCPGWHALFQACAVLSRALQRWCCQHRCGELYPRKAPTAAWVLPGREMLALAFSSCAQHLPKQTEPHWGWGAMLLPQLGAASSSGKLRTIWALPSHLISHTNAQSSSLVSFPAPICGQRSGAGGTCLGIGQRCDGSRRREIPGEEWLRGRSMGEGPDSAAVGLCSAQRWLRDMAKPPPNALPAPWQRFSCPSCSAQASWSSASHCGLAPCPSISMFLPSAPCHVLDPGR